MADYWIKLYHEIIDDPKMATLPDRLWRRTIELFLLAGKLCPDKSGELPETKQLAWLLRMPVEELQNDLEQLATETGIIAETETGWRVNNFQKRQGAATSTERVQQYRKRKHSEQYYDNETETKRNVTQSRAEQSRAEAEQSRADSAAAKRPEIFRIYEREIGALTPMIAEALIEAEKVYPQEWFAPAFQEAAHHNARSWKYAESILKRWKVDGFKKNNKPNPNGKSPPGKKEISELTPEERRQLYAGGEYADFVEH